MPKLGFGMCIVEILSRLKGGIDSWQDLGELLVVLERLWYLGFNWGGAK